MRRGHASRNVLSLAAFAVLLLVLTISTASVAKASSQQVSSTVSLQYFTVQAQYPSIVQPGDDAQVNVQANAKSTANLGSLDAQIFYVQGSSLQQITSATIVSNQNVASGNTFSKIIQVQIPQGAPRTALFASFTESVKVSYTNGYSYSSYNYNYPYDYGCSYYTYDYNNNMQYYCYYPSGYNYYSSYPSYSSYTTSDSGISPLSYINATTPEYTNLLSQYQSTQQQLNQAQTQNQNLQQQVNQLNQQNSQLQTQNQQLQQQLQNAQNSISQSQSDNNNLTNQLSNTSLTKQYLAYIVIGLGILVIVMAVFASGRGGEKSRKTQSVNPYAANYEPPKQRT
jgi:predicted PurR-regulated permease PerM